MPVVVNPPQNTTTRHEQEASPSALLQEEALRGSLRDIEDYTRNQIRKQIAAAARSPSSQETKIPHIAGPTKALEDTRVEHVLKLQESYRRQTLDHAAPEQRERLAGSLRESEELLSQYQKVCEQIRADNLNTDPALLGQLKTRSELLLKESVATLLHANTEQTVAGIAQGQKLLIQKAESLQEEILGLEKLEENDPQLLAGILQAKRGQLKSLKETGDVLDTMKTSLSGSLTAANSFLRRSHELGKAGAISPAQFSEASANIDSALLVLEDADRKTNLQAIDSGLRRLEEAHREDLERREAIAKNISSYNSQEQLLRDAVKKSIGRAHSIVGEVVAANTHINKVNSTFNPFEAFASLVTGTHAALESSRDNLLTEANEQNGASGALIQEWQTVRKAKETYIELTEAGFKAEQVGNTNKAQLLFNRAQQVKEASSILANPDAVNQALIQPSKNWQQRNHYVSEQLQEAISSANSWEAGLEVARNVTVAAGATVATIATAGAGAGLFLSFAAGTGGGIVVGSLSNSSEQATAAASGVKSGEQAWADFARRFQQDAITSLEAAGATATGLGAGRAFQSSTLATKLSAPVAQPISGLLGGGASGTTTAAIDTTRTLYQRNETIAEFNRSAAAQTISPEQRKEALEALLSERRLGLDDLARRGIVTIASGAVGGGIGAKTGAMRETAKTSLGQVSTAAVDTTANLTLGLSATALSDGEISLEQGLTQGFQSVFVGNALSSLPARRLSGAEAASGTSTMKTNVNPRADAGEPGILPPDGQKQSKVATNLDNKNSVAGTRLSKDRSEGQSIVETQPTASQDALVSESEKHTHIEQQVKANGKPTEVGRRIRTIPLEEKSDTPTRSGQEFMVLRVATGGELARTNAGNSQGVAGFLARADDSFNPTVAAKGEFLYVYGVTVSEEFGNYSAFNRGSGGSGSLVGRQSRNGEIWYSFPDDGYHSRIIDKIPMEEVRKTLRRRGFDNFDDSGSIAGGEIIRQVIDDRLASRGQAKLLPPREGVAQSTTERQSEPQVELDSAIRPRSELTSPEQPGSSGTQSLQQPQHGTALTSVQARHAAAPALANPVLDKSVNMMLLDTDHPMDTTRNLQHPEYGPPVRSNLGKAGKTSLTRCFVRNGASAPFR